jgi:hypothetical protein
LHGRLPGKAHTTNAEFLTISGSIPDHGNSEVNCRNQAIALIDLMMSVMTIFHQPSSQSAHHEMPRH